LVCRADSPLAQSTLPIEWSDLDNANLILNETTRGIRAQEFQALAARTTMSVRNMTSLLAMVRAGIGVTLLPGLATVGLPTTLVSRPVSDESCRRQVCMLLREGRIQSPLTHAFQRHFTDSVKAITEDYAIVSIFK
jgi:DNA-binding transcriptional LysR family regulator